MQPPALRVMDEIEKVMMLDKRRGKLKGD